MRLPLTSRAHGGSHASAGFFAGAARGRGWACPTGARAGAGVDFDVALGGGSVTGSAGVSAAGRGAAVAARRSTLSTAAGGASTRAPTHPAASSTAAAAQAHPDRFAAGGGFGEARGAKSMALAVASEGA